MRIFRLIPALMLMNAIQPNVLAQSFSKSAALSDGAGSAKAATVKQVITMNLALKDGQFYLGEIQVRSLKRPCKPLSRNSAEARRASS